jgi:hypothetical protein
LRVNWWSLRDGSRWAVVREVVKVLEKTAALAMRKVTRSAGIGCANRSALEIGVFMKVASICWHSRTARRDGLTVVAVVVSAVGWIVKVARGLHQ